METLKTGDFLKIDWGIPKVIGKLRKRFLRKYFQTIKNYKTVSRMKFRKHSLTININQ